MHPRCKLSKEYKTMSDKERNELNSVSHRVAILGGILCLLVGGAIGFMFGMERTMGMVEKSIAKPAMLDFKSDTEWLVKSHQIETDMLKRQVKFLMDQRNMEKRYPDLSEGQKKAMRTHNQAWMRVIELVPDHGVVTEWNRNGETITVTFTDKTKKVFKVADLLKERDEYNNKILGKIAEMELEGALGVMETLQEQNDEIRKLLDEVLKEKK